MAYTRVHRLLRVLLLIQSEPGWNARRLALECRVTERTIYRDLEELEGAGVPWYFEQATDGYRVRKDFYLQPLQLTPEEMHALELLLREAPDDEPTTANARVALRKIRAQLPAHVRAASALCTPSDGAVQRTVDATHEQSKPVAHNIEVIISTPECGAAGISPPNASDVRFERSDAEEGSTIVNFTTHDLDGAARWLLGLRGQGVAIAPSHFVRRVREGAENVLRTHAASENIAPPPPSDNNVSARRKN